MSKLPFEESVLANATISLFLLCLLLPSMKKSSVDLFDTLGLPHSAAWKTYKNNTDELCFWTCTFKQASSCQKFITAHSERSRGWFEILKKNIYWSGHSDKTNFLEKNFFVTASGLKKETTNGVDHTFQTGFEFFWAFHISWLFHEFFKFATTLGLAVTKKIFKNILA